MTGSIVGGYSLGGYSVGGYSEPTTDFGFFGSMCSIEGLQCGGATVTISVGHLSGPNHLSGDALCGVNILSGENHTDSHSVYFSSATRPPQGL